MPHRHPGRRKSPTAESAENRLLRVGSDRITLAQLGNEFFGDEVGEVGREGHVTHERCAGVFSGVRAHSPAPAVAEAAQHLRRLEADAVVAVGGGSAIVTARAASILLAEKGELASLSTAMDEHGSLRSPKLAAPKLPQLIIPTTPTTAMVKAGSAVSDPEAGVRRALFDPKTRAQSIFIHPDFVRS